MNAGDLETVYEPAPFPESRGPEKLRVASKGLSQAPPRRESRGRIKVLFLLTSTAGGVGLCTYYLAKYLPKSEFDITVGFGPGYPLDRDIAGLDVRVVHFSMSRDISPLTNLCGLAQVYRFLRSDSFDVVCAACSIAGFIGRIAGWLARVPVRIFSIHLFASHPQQTLLKRSAYRLIERALDPLTTRYVAVSEAMLRYGVSHRVLSEDKVEVIYNGVTLDDKVAAPRSRCRAELGLRPDSLVVGTLARLDRQKGLEYLLQAAAIVARRFHDVEFLIAGDGPLRVKLQALSSQLGIGQSVKFVGHRRDVSQVLSSIDVFCLPSLWEAFPMALAESMAMEKPVVATRVDGVPEAVQDGETGLLVPPRDPQALADAISRLLADPDLRQRMGKAGRARVERNFTVSQMIRRYGELLKGLARPAELAGRDHKCSESGQLHTPGA